MANEKRNRLTRFVSRNFSFDDGEPNPALDQLERLTNSAFITNIFKQLGLETEEYTEDDPSWSDRQMKNVIRRIAPAQTIKQLEAEDEDVAFAMLQTIPGLEEGQDELMRLHKAIEAWDWQGADLHKQSTKLHAVIFSDNDDLAIQFAQNYHAYLTACGVLSERQPLVRANGSSHRSLLSVDALDGGMCLLLDAQKLSCQGAKEFGNQMESNGAVFVASYTGAGEKLQKSLRDGHFFLSFQLTEKQPPDPVACIQDYMLEWIQSKYQAEIEFEGGLRGQWTETFAQNILATLADKNGKVGNEAAHNKRMHKEVRRQLAAVLDRQHSRLMLPGADLDHSHPCLITREDLLGGEPSTKIMETEAWKELHKMVGQQQVKDAVQSFANAVLLDHHRAMYGQKPARSGLSRLFIGPPGTGKTTVGKLYGQILCSLGLLSSGEFVYKKASDFIGAYIGHSERQTREILKDAKGKVLMIDEAYMLDPTRNRHSGADPFRAAVLGTIVEEIENKPGEDICVILAGYKDQMEHMLRYANPGLARRFPLVDAFVFEEFDNRQLEKVLEFKAEEQQFEMTDEAKEIALGILKLAKHRDNFGNGGEVVNLLGRALANYRTRFGQMSPGDRRIAGRVRFEAQDFDPDWKEVHRVADRVEQLFSDMVCIDEVKDSFLSLARRCTALRKAGHDPGTFMPFNFTFSGPHGTGKTTVAKKMGWLFRAMRLISTDEVVQTSVRDLVATRMNERAGISMSEKPATIFGLVKSALGKVLVIDQAHQLFGEDNDQTDMMIRDVRGELTEAVKGRLCRKARHHSDWS